ncbi:MAG: hypothetical protein HOK57_11755 [Planctomycetaceae bacterium]|jgi:hypothetical protein|nr:hypothetical protein [Planctomycetaceae bacterium]MBT6053831.1 hypothetical protein [Planctomycetaceae bacterium]MBT6460470.1 hypothetical protein [Planctomycetaceae bacterium]MBT6641996.1 hypothetical protein [Planctomycetaceae bacterium]MBT6918881.1 hypothetical protein [Planctomycetaceae bacterium]
MARRQKKKQEVSLFPFLDILACVIGNLILIITAVVLESVDSDKIAEQFANEAVQQQTEQNLQAIRDLEESLKKLKQDSISSDTRVQKAQQQLAEAERAQREARGRLLDVPPPPPPPDDEDTAELKKRELEIQEIIAEMKRIEAKIADKKKKPDQTISVLYENKGRGGVRRPFFVEITKNDLVLLPNALDYKNLFDSELPIKIPVAKAASDKSFTKLLDYVLTHLGKTGLLRRRRDTIITFLVRPEGVNTYRTVKQIVDQYEKKNENRLVVGMLPNGAPVLDALSGKAPLPGEGKILLD